MRFRFIIGIGFILLLNSLMMPLMAQSDECIISASRDVNRRASAGTTFDIVGILSSGTQSVAIAQQVDAQNFVWYELAEGGWVRSDIVTVSGNCDQLGTTSTTNTTTTDTTTTSSDNAVTTFEIDFRRPSDLYELSDVANVGSNGLDAYIDNADTQIQFKSLHMKGDFELELNFQLRDHLLGFDNPFRQLSIGVYTYSEFVPSPTREITTAYFVSENFFAVSSQAADDYIEPRNFSWRSNTPYTFRVSVIGNTVTLALNDELYQQFNRTDIIVNGSLTIYSRLGDVTFQSLSVRALGWSFEEVKAAEEFTALTNGVELFEPLNNGEIREFTYEGVANDLVSFNLEFPTEEGVVVEVYNPDGDLIARGRQSQVAYEAGSVTDLLLPTSGTYAVRLVNTNESSIFEDVNRGEFTLAVQLVQSDVEELTLDASMLAVFDPTSLNGKFIDPLARFIFSRADGLAFSYTTNMAVALQESTNRVIISRTDETLQQALASDDILRGLEDEVFYVWYMSVEEAGVRTASELVLALQQEHLSSSSPYEGDTPEIPLVALQPYYGLFLDDRSNVIYVLPVSNVGFIVGIDIDGTGGSNFRFPGAMGVFDSVSMSSLPFFTPVERDILGLPQERVDAPTITLDVELGATYDATSLPISFDYPDDENWQVSDTASTTSSMQMIGTPVILLYDDGNPEPVQVSVFLPSSIQPFSAASTLDILTLTIGALGFDSQYSVERVYVDNTLLTIVDLTISGEPIRRVEVRLRGGAKASVLVNGDDIDRIDRDILLAIAASIRVN
jgi:hypothetical protein